MNIDFHFRLRGVTREQAEALHRIIQSIIDAMGGVIVGGPVFDVPDDKYIPE